MDNGYPFVIQVLSNVIHFLKIWEFSGYKEITFFSKLVVFFSCFPKTHSTIGALSDREYLYLCGRHCRYNYFFGRGGSAAITISLGGTAAITISLDGAAAMRHCRQLFESLSVQ